MALIIFADAKLNNLHKIEVISSRGLVAYGMQGFDYENVCVKIICVLLTVEYDEERMHHFKN